MGSASLLVFAPFDLPPPELTHTKLPFFTSSLPQLEDLLKLSAEDILLRWFNYHLKNAGSARRVTNFGSDLKDSECYSILLNQISKCGLVGAGDDKAKATQVIANANAMGVESFIQPGDIVKGNKKLNLGFCAQIFNTNSGLVISEEEVREHGGSCTTHTHTHTPLIFACC